MNIKEKIIITDTNIITDLTNCNLLNEFIKLDNVYMCDICKYDEVTEATGDIDLINNIKLIEVTPDEFNESSRCFALGGKLSLYDWINYVVARDNNGILATGDKRLKTFAEENGVEVIRILKIIRMLKNNNVINNNQVINACNLLKNNSKTRVPFELIDNLIDECQKDLAPVC